MGTAAKKAYDKHLENVYISRSMTETAKLEGKSEEKTIIILNAHNIGISVSKIAAISSISEEEVLSILRKHGKI